MNQTLMSALLAAAVATVAVPAHAAPVLVTNQPWGADTDIGNMTQVFGAGAFLAYGSYAHADAAVASIFSSANRFVMLEGGAATDSLLADYLGRHAGVVKAWVNGGGALLIQSAGWGSSIAFDGVNLSYGNENGCGTLSAAGIDAFGVDARQCGGYLAHNEVVGEGLTHFMTGDTWRRAIVAGKEVGLGYVMYSGLTASRFHDRGYGLVNGIIGYTARQAQASEVPEPAPLALLGLGAVAIGALRRRPGGQAGG